MTYYLPINSTSLAHYFVCACIKPAKYFDNKPQDIQDRFCNALLLSSERGTKDTDCCIELVLTKEEEKCLIPHGNLFYLFPTPLPISRIKAICFRDIHQMELTLSNINMSAAFIPPRLAKVEQFSNVEFDVVNLEKKLDSTDYVHQLTMFNRILGALALMRTAKEPYMNYSENYASTLSFFNSQVKEDLANQGRQVNDKFFGLFTRNNSFRTILPYLEKNITKEDLDQIAAENKQRIERSITKAINFDKLSGRTYAVAILQYFGVGEEAATKKIDHLIATNFKELKEGTAEGIALYYGYNRGYSVFSNSYGTQESGKQIVKYRLDSQLDYYTIESVYRFAFYGNTSSSQFPYIDEWCPRKNQQPKRKTDYMVMDTVFIGKKKPLVSSREYLLAFLEEIKSFDFIKIPIGSLVELIINKVAGDAKEEIEDATESRIINTEKELTTKFNEAQAIIDSQNGRIAFLEESILDLKRQNESLVDEVKRLESATCILQEPKMEAKELNLEGPSVENTPIAGTSSVSDGNIMDKKGTKPTKAKSGDSKSKGAPRSTKKSSKVDVLENANKEAEQSLNQANEEDLKPSSTISDELFDYENE